MKKWRTLALVGTSQEAAYHNLGAFAQSSRRGITKASDQYGSILCRVNSWLSMLFPLGTWSSLCISHNELLKLHQDLTNAPGALNYTVSLGDFSGGGLLLESPSGALRLPLPTSGEMKHFAICDTKSSPLAFDGTLWHGTEEFAGDRWLSCCKYKSLFSTENFRIFMMRKFRLSVLGKLYKSWERIFLVAIRATELFCSGQGAMAEAPNLEGILAPLLLRVARLEAHVTTMDLPFVEDRLDNMETVVAALGREFDALAQRLEELQRQIRRLEAAVYSLERERRSINDLADRISNLEIASGQETQRALEYHQIVLQELDHRVASLESPAHPDNP